VVSDTEQNLRINVANGVTIVDGTSPTPARDAGAAATRP
jgi:hypothetical protein